MKISDLIESLNISLNTVLKEYGDVNTEVRNLAGDKEYDEPLNISFSNAKRHFKRVSEGKSFVVFIDI